MTVLFIIGLISITYSLGNAYSEDSQSLQIEVKYTNGDRIDAYQTHYVVYQDRNNFV